VISSLLKKPGFQRMCGSARAWFYWALKAFLVTIEIRWHQVAIDASDGLQALAMSGQLCG
jgi:hypothetical protein